MNMELLLLVVIVIGTAAILITGIRQETTVRSVSMLLAMSGLLAFLFSEYLRRTTAAESWIDVVLPVALLLIIASAFLWFLDPDLSALGLYNDDETRK
ncbi:hypothetical protein [Natronorubrum sp. A-ect3]|uniref:hypothetical protein n=1 Tax=Natronorubrum sp. A-ect3 TaxID=3242698 RepID=UPI00359E08A6